MNIKNFESLSLHYSSILFICCLVISKPNYYRTRLYEGCLKNFNLDLISFRIDVSFFTKIKKVVYAGCV